MKNRKSDYDEKKLLKKSSQGDEAVFWILWEEHQKSVFQKCQNILKDDPVKAEEIFSNILFKIQSILPDHAARITNFKLWILRITENMCIDVLRKSTKNLRFDDLEEKNQIYEPGLYDTPENEFEEESDRLMELFYSQLSRIPSKHRYILIFRCIYNKSYDEISLFFMITNDTCRKRYEIARKYLQRSLLAFKEFDIDHIFSESSKIRESSIWEKIENEIASVIANRKTEIDIITSFSKIIIRKQISGIDRFFLIFCHASYQKKRTRVSTLKKYISLHPTGWKKRLELGKLLFVRGEWNIALIELATVLNIYPGSIEARIVLAELHLKNGRKDQAVRIFKEGLPYLLNQSSKHFFTGMINYCSDRFKDAIVHFNLAAVLESNNAYFPFLEGMMHLKMNRLNAAKFAFEQAIKINPSDIKPYTFYQDILQINGFIEQSVKFAFDTCRRFPDDLISLKQMILARCRKGLVYGSEGISTRNLIKNIKKQNPQLPMMLDVKASYLFFRGEWENTFKLIDKSVPTGGNHYTRIKWMLALGEITKAKEYLIEYADRYKFPSPKITFLACKTLIAEKKYHLAEKMLDDIFFSEKSNVDIQLRLLKMLSISGASPQIIKKYSTSIMKKSDIPEVLFMYAKSLLSSDKIRLAQRITLEGWNNLKADSFSTSAFSGALLMAISHNKLKNHRLYSEWYKVALMSAHRIIQIDPGYGWFCIGNLDSRFNKTSTARIAYLNSLDSNLPFPYRESVLDYLGKKS